MNSNAYVPFNIIRSGFAVNGKYPITQPKKLDKKMSYLKGNVIKFLKLIGSDTVSIEFKGSKQFIKLSAILGYENRILVEPSIDDTCFIVTAKNDYFDIGAIFETSVFNANGHIGFFNSKNERITLPLSCIKALRLPVQNEDIAQQLSTKYNVQIEKSVKIVDTSVVIEEPTVKIPVVEVSSDVAMLEPISVKDKSHEDCKATQVAVSSDVASDYVHFDLTNYDAIIPLVNERLATIQGEFLDMLGRPHTTFLQCLKANQHLIDVAYLENIKDVIADEITKRS